ncbi:dephospho-CoA kinase [Helicobacter sp. MIT 14-3879]|uniref:dephospho-CoA kinase n=1 Tax=Helicobacter sp. MIT 14-3879 TaxID=2040649 RepID=UPI000E1EC2BC|nr:dephospho-CoA kinase [Helicobacter sp. MIT 14-3879]RDU65457.1 dephospho-CoA kinase [Helicobacter sp. MIT 14-3879]
MSFKNAIVITGGIGSGKSTVCNLLKLYGYTIIDADNISHLQLEASKNEVIAYFGSEILKNGNIDRKKLGQIVFNDKNKLQILENILHPKIKEEIYKETRKLESNNTKYFIDIPIFFEMKAKNNAFDIYNILLIYAPKDLQIKRIIKRDNLSYEDAVKRIENQIDIEEKKKLATYTIENTASLAALQTNIETFLKTIS